MKFLAATFLSFSAISLARESLARELDTRSPQKYALVSREKAPHGTFDQLIDHSNPSFGTFKQRYWYNTDYWKGGNHPIVLKGFGESAINATATVDSFADNRLTTQYAIAIGGAQVLLEHRYYGDSTPYTDFTADNLRFHTVDQAVQDLTYFARNVKLPFDTGNGLTNAPNSPWVLTGCSYSAALTTWTAVSAPGTFWAYHGSSAPVQAIENFWEYQTPIKRALPINCTGDLTRVLNYIDDTLDKGTAEEVSTLKTNFGYANGSDDGFANYLTGPIFAFQSGRTKTLKFCDALEDNGEGNPPPGPEGLGREKALANFQTYMNPKKLSFAVDSSRDELCFNVDENFCNKLPPSSEVAVKETDHNAWEWMLCNEPFGWWQTGAYIGDTTLFSRRLTTTYWEKECAKKWPDATFNHSSNAINDKYGGWNPKTTSTTKLMLSGGTFDPWGSAGVMSEYRPGGPMVSTPEFPLFLFPEGNHCPDLYYPNPNKELTRILDLEIAQINAWVQEFYTQGPGNNTSSGSSTSTGLGGAIQSMGGFGGGSGNGASTTSTGYGIAAGSSNPTGSLTGSPTGYSTGSPTGSSSGGGSGSGSSLGSNGTATWSASAPPATSISFIPAGAAGKESVERSVMVVAVILALFFSMI